MTDAEYDLARRRAEACLQHWQFRFGLLCAWRVEITWERVNRSDRAQDGDHRQFVMSVSTDWEYLTVYVTVYCAQVVQMDDADLSRVCRHELLHALVNEMRMWRYYDERTDSDKMYRMHEERVVCQLEQAFNYCTDRDLDISAHPWPLPAEAESA